MIKPLSSIQSTLDANEAVANVAYRVCELFAIYPITPSSPMGEWVDEWSAKKKKNLWGHTPEVIELQSEGGEILGGTPEQFSTLLRAEVPRWAKIVKESGATLD